MGTKKKMVVQGYTCFIEEFAGTSFYLDSEGDLKAFEDSWKDPAMFEVYREARDRMDIFLGRKDIIKLSHRDLRDLLHSYDVECCAYCLRERSDHCEGCKDGSGGDIYHAFRFDGRYGDVIRPEYETKEKTVIQLPAPYISQQMRGMLDDLEDVVKSDEIERDSVSMIMRMQELWADEKPEEPELG